MKSHATKSSEAVPDLRTRAEERLRTNAHVSDDFPLYMESARLLHELQVHHIELEMQNEELLLAAKAADKNMIDNDLLVSQSKITKQLLNDNRTLLEELLQKNSALEERISQGVQELRKMDNLLLSQNRQAAMGEMIGNIAHQWRQPLNSLGLSIQGLSVAYEVGDFSEEFLYETVKDSMTIIEHMSQTINDFMNFFSPDKEMVVFAVNKMLNTTVSLIQDSLKNNNIKLDIILQGNLFIKGYPNEYSQALLNVIINARDALVKNNVKQPLISVSSFMEKEKSVVVITDNAGGIPEQYIGQVFEPYFTTKGPGQGTGIGLYMTKTIIENHMNGRVSVCNKNGGAEFRIEV